MDDEADPWGDVEETPAEPPPAAEGEGAAPAEGGEGAPAAEGEAAPAAEGGAVDEAPPAPRPRDPNRPIYFKYFNRKTHLNYSYLYDYRHSYYDDVIKYLDERQRGRQLDIPRPQTWAERALRTAPERIRTAQAASKDSELLSRIRTSNQAYYYHTREYVNRRHSGTYL